MGTRFGCIQQAYSSELVLPESIHFHQLHNFRFHLCVKKVPFIRLLDCSAVLVLARPCFPNKCRSVTVPSVPWKVLGSAVLARYG